MNQKHIEETLEDLPMGGVYYFSSVGSTNEVALRLSEEGVDDFTLVIADCQTNGRGRSGRRWFTYPGTGLALSLILRPTEVYHPDSLSFIPRYTGLGALAVCQLLREQYSLQANVKWPNDVLINNDKCCGILVEACWFGERLMSVVLGIGINLTAEAVPVMEELRMTATSIELALNKTVDRLIFLRRLLRQVLKWRSELHQDSFLQAWESNLAYLGKKALFFMNSNFKSKSGRYEVGMITGLEKDGSLKLMTLTGEEIVIHNGEIIQVMET